MNYTLVIAVLLSICNWAYCDEQAQERVKAFMENQKKCGEKYNVTKVEFTPGIKLEGEQKCYYHCMANLNGLMDENGNLTLDKFKTLHPNAPPEIINEYISCLTGKENMEKCQKAHELQQCIKKHHQEEMQKFLKDRIACLKEQNLAENYTGPWTKDNVCFFKCLAIKMNAMNAAGEPTVEKYNATHPSTPHIVIENIQTCVNGNKQPDVCEKAKATIECVAMKSNW